MYILRIYTYTEDLELCIIWNWLANLFQTYIWLSLLRFLDFLGTQGFFYFKNPKKMQPPCIFHSHFNIKHTSCHAPGQHQSRPTRTHSPLRLEPCAGQATQHAWRAVFVSMGHKEHRLWFYKQREVSHYAFLQELETKTTFPFWD